MATAPYGVRLLVGRATVAVEETMKLPKTVLMYPRTLASTAAPVVMRFQQNLAELVIKGDSTLESLFPPKDEKPEWATFDEDLLEGEGAVPALADDRGPGGLFPFYSVPGEDARAADPRPQPIATRQSRKSAGKATVPAP